MEDIILAHKLHRFVVNPQIPLMFNKDEDHIANIRSEECESWIVQDQVLFTWILSTILESMLPRVLSRKHLSQIWDQIHKYFTALMKARVHQLRAKLKITKKANRSISEFVLCIRAIADALLVVGELISKHDQIDVILQGLPEEYNSFIMMVCGKIEPPTLYEIEALLYVQEAQLDKSRQELTLANATTNIALYDDNNSNKSTRGGSQ